MDERWRLQGSVRSRLIRLCKPWSWARIDARLHGSSGRATVIGFFGHAVAETNDGLKALIGAATVFADPGFLFPVRNWEVFRWCLENGIRIVEPMTLMTVGLYNAPAGAFLPSILY